MNLSIISSTLSYDPTTKASWGSFWQLPEEIVTIIYTYLQGKEVVALTGLNTIIKQALNTDDSLWLRLNARDFSSYASDSGALIATPSQLINLSAKDMYIQNLREHSCKTMRWCRSHITKSSHGHGPGSREGTAIATACGGDALVLLAGWSNSWPTIRNDTFVLDLNPITNQDVTYLLRSFNLASSDISINKVPFIAARSLSTLSVDQVSSLLETLSQKARALLHGKSPARTGAIPMVYPTWKRVTPSSNLPRPRYGHSATTVILSEDSWILASKEWSESESSSAAASASSSSSSTTSDSASKRAIAAATSRGGSIAPSPELRKSLQWHRRDLPSSPSALPPSIVTSMNAKPEDYGKPPLGSHEVIVVFGGMFSGGYTNETNEVWIEKVEMQTVASIDEDLKMPIEEEGDEKVNDKIDEDRSKSPKSKKFKGAVVEDSTLSSVSSTISSDIGVDTSVLPIKNHGAVVIERRLAAEWRRVIPKNLHRLQGRGYHIVSYVAPKRCLWVSGGISNGDSIWSLQAISVDTWETSNVETVGISPCPRHGHSLTCIAKRVFVFGGGTGGDILREGDELRDLNVLDLETMHWSQPILSPLFEKRLPSLKWTGRCHTATAVGSKLIIYGGNTELSNKVAVIDTSTMQLFEPNVIYGDDDCLPRPRYNHNALRVGRRIHMIGGWADGKALSDHSILDLCPYIEAERLVLQDISLDGTIKQANEKEREDYFNEFYLNDTEGDPDFVDGADDEDEDDNDNDEDDDDDEEEEGMGRDRGGRGGGRGGFMDFLGAMGFRGGVINERVLRQLLRAGLVERRQDRPEEEEEEEEDENVEGEGEEDEEDEDDNNIDDEDNDKDGDKKDDSDDLDE
jgi:hypothetical protein